MIMKKLAQKKKKLLLPDIEGPNAHSNMLSSLLGVTTKKEQNCLDTPPMNCKEHGNSLLLGEIPPIGIK